MHAGEVAGAQHSDVTYIYCELLAISLVSICHLL